MRGNVGLKHKFDIRQEDSCGGSGICFVVVEKGSSEKTEDNRIAQP